MTPLAVAWTEAWFRWIAAATWQLALLAAIVGVVCWITRKASPRLRYGLWLLVLLKAFVPPPATAVWGVGSWGVAPLWERAKASKVGTKLTSAWSAETGVVETTGAESHESAAQPTPSTTPASLTTPLFVAWSTGCALFIGAAVFHYARLCRATRRMRLIDEGPLRVELERMALDLGQTRTPDLYASETASSPFLFGVFRPAIVAPRELLDRDSESARAVLLHEMHHWRRRDPWIGWLQVVAQGLFWFHPLAWWANARLRAEREAACDDAVLRTGALPAAEYAETLLRILTLARGRSLVMGSMAGVFERGADLQTRLEAIMNFQPERRRFNGLSRLALVAFALVFLPMGLPASGESTAEDAAASQAAEEGEVATPPDGPPSFVSKPENGATEVDPAVSEIVLTFDRDMEQGMSWTGGPENLPSPDETRKPQWRDARTCVLPVILKRGAYYRVGVNSTSFQNFRSTDGVPVRPAAIAFTTAGAKPALVRRLRAPQVVEAEPAQDARDVDPATKFLRVTFDMPMGAGMSWTGDVPAAAGQRARWSRDARTCIMPVELEPGRSYSMGLNSPSHVNFQSKWGVPLEAVRFAFTTSGEGDASAGDASEKPVSEAPTIVAMTPENGATDVDPGLKVIRVTFDRPMAAGFSWTGGGPEFPPIPPGKKPSWSRDRRSCTLPVALEPNHAYRLGLNSVSFKNFASADGVPLEPVMYEFTTGP